MIATKFHNGQGAGNILFCYATVRAIALKLGWEFSILNRKEFKCKSFMDIDFGSDNQYFPNHYQEKKIFNHFGKDVSPMDEDMFKIKPYTIVDGTMQSLRYFDGISRQTIREWMHPRENNIRLADDICILHYRGGDFRMAGNTLLTKKYYQDAMSYMKSKNPDIKFYVVTDDPRTAWETLELPIVGSSCTQERDEFQASHHVGFKIDYDYNLLYSARNIILSNSSFGFWPAYTNPTNPLVVAPAYWAAHNYDEPFWSTNDMQVPGWNYIDKRGNLL